VLGDLSADDSPMDKPE